MSAWGCPEPSTGISDPRGHSFGKLPERPEPPDPDHGLACRAYLYGIDLFNHGYYWESHESWEGLWHACGRTGILADFLKGLIQLAAAGVKHREGRPQGVRSHARRAADLWQGMVRSLGAGSDSFLGLRLGELIGLAEAVCQTGWPANAPVLLPTYGGE